MIPARGLLVLGLLGGCSDEIEPACREGQAVVTIGRGDPEFEAFAQGEEVVLVHGIQGGYHTDLSLELRGLGSDPTIELSGEIGGVRLAEDFVSADGPCVDGRVLLGDLRLVWAALPEQLDGASARIEARATDAGGTMVSAEVTVVIVDPLVEGSP